jgi:hypothetical protein
LTRPPDTSSKNAKCYARELGGCSKNITREHYISRGLLEEMGGTTDVSGLNFIPPGVKRGIGSGALTAKVLCEDHNRALSPLDEVALSFYRSIRLFDAGLRDGAKVKAELVQLHADLLERWMLKALVGMTEAGVIRTTSLKRGFPVLAVLYGLCAWPESTGLYVLDPGQPMHAFSGVGVETMVVDNEIRAAVFEIAGPRFALSLGRPEGLASYRPAKLVFRRSDNSAAKTLALQWIAGPGSDSVTYERVSQYDGPRPQDAHLEHEKRAV